MNIDDRITIVVVSDNHYVIMLAALIKSIEINHITNEVIDFYIIEDKITTSNKSKIFNSIKSNSINIFWIKMVDAIPSNSKLPLDTSTFPLNVYVRLFIPYFIPQNIIKVIYMDVDMVVNEDISKLWYTDLKDFFIAGVLDRSEVVSSKWGGIENFKELGLSFDTKYYNSGLLLMRCDKWRDAEITVKVIDCVEKNINFTRFPDQYGLNVVFANEWLDLDKKWNCYSISNEENPYIIHFIGRKPIYKSYNYNEEYKKLFFKYISLTDWKGFIPISETRRLLKKIINISRKKYLKFKVTKSLFDF